MGNEKRREEVKIQFGMEEDAEEEYMGQAKFKLFFNGGPSCELDPKAEVRYKRRDVCPGSTSY